jgi:hypothetical protein
MNKNMYIDRINDHDAEYNLLATSNNSKGIINTATHNKHGCKHNKHCVGDEMSFAVE